MQRYDWPRHLATLASPKSDTSVSFWKSSRAKQDLHTDTLSLDNFGYFLDFTMDSFWISVKNAQEAAYEKVGWVLSLIIINLSSAQWFWLWCFQPESQIDFYQVHTGSNLNILTFQLKKAPQSTVNLISNFARRLAGHAQAPNSSIQVGRSFKTFFSRGCH